MGIIRDPSDRRRKAQEDAEVEVRERTPTSEEIDVLPSRILIPSVGGRIELKQTK